jgi:hypothetical protein
MSLKRLHSGCFHRTGGTLLRKPWVCQPLFQRLIVSLHSFTVNPNPSHFLCLVRLSSCFTFQGSTAVLVRIRTVLTSGSLYSLSIHQVNFIQQPLPNGSKTGAGGKFDVSGALGRGQAASTGLTTLLQFW